ncbi:MAG: hypothetical protein IJO20_04975 [Ruminococcus sp.]|nr:hypothetical protein [Ruminococcus sp.]
MISKESYDKLKKYYWDVASWTIWLSPNGKPKSRMGDMSVFDDPDLLNKLNNRFVFVGLNGSGKHDDYLQSDLPWFNFHSSLPSGNDYKLRYALMDTPLWGSYITDIIKYHPEVDSKKVKEYVRSHPDVLKKNIESFKKELEFLGGNPIVVALGDDSYNFIVKNLTGAYQVVKVKHYSSRISKEDYRDNVLSVLLPFLSDDKFSVNVDEPCIGVKATSTTSKKKSAINAEPLLTYKLTPEMRQQIAVLQELQHEYPTLSFRRRGKSANKMYDIVVTLNDIHILTLSSVSSDYPGRIYTDYLSQEDINNSVKMIDRSYKDPDPDSVFVFYRYREKWSPKYYKWYSDYEKMKEEIIKIIKNATKI